MGITELGYVRFGVSDIEAWRSFATDMLGLEVRDDSAETLMLRNDLWHHRIELVKDESDDLLVAGLRVAGPAEFDEVQNTLRDAGVSFELGSASLARERHVLALLSLEDPAGNPLEIFHGPHVDAARPFHPGRAMYAFVPDPGALGI